MAERERAGGTVMPEPSLLVKLTVCVFTGLLIGGFICAIVICIRYRKQLKGLGRFAYPVAGILAVLLFFAVLLTFPFPPLFLPFALLGAGLHFTVVTLYTTAGLALAQREGLNPFPLLSKLWGRPPGPPPALPSEPAPDEEAPVTGEPERPSPGLEATAQSELRSAPVPAMVGESAPPRPAPPDLPLRVRGRLRPWVLVVVACVAFNVYSAVLFRLSGAQPSQMVRKALMSAEDRESFEQAKAAGKRWRPGLSLATALVVTHAALLEELLFRLFWLTLVVRLLRRVPGRLWIGVVLVSAVWALGHTVAVEPVWVKLAQIFVGGLLIGRVYLRAGVEGAVAVHLSLNLLGPWLIGW